MHDHLEASEMRRETGAAADIASARSGLNSWWTKSHATANCLCFFAASDMHIIEAGYSCNATVSRVQHRSEAAVGQRVHSAIIGRWNIFSIAVIGILSPD